MEAEHQFAGQYRVIKSIGEGGMGMVYLAEDASLSQKVALKIFHPMIVTDKFRFRLNREIEILKLLHNPHIVKLIDFGFAENRYYIVMEYLYGLNLKTLITQRAPLPTDEIEKIFTQILDGLGAAHKQGIIHRDLKPANIVSVHQFNNEPFIKIVDFGLAIDTYDGVIKRVTQTKELVGSPQYIAPELIRGPRKLSPQSDIYSLGIVLYELLSGQKPVTGDHSLALLMGHLSRSPVPIVCPECEEDPLRKKLIDIAMTCLEKQPENRYQSVADIQAFLEGQGNRRE